MINVCHVPFCFHNKVNNKAGFLDLTNGEFPLDQQKQQMQTHSNADYFAH